LASEAEVTDVRTLTVEARRVLLPALAARGGPLHVGPSFVGSPDVGGADGDVIVGGLLAEWKTTRGDPRRSDGRRHCRLDRDTLYQLLGYLLLDYQDEYAIDTLALYSARYVYLVTWPVVELLTELAGGPVDLAELRIGFQEAARRSASTKSLSNRDRRPPGKVRRRRARRADP
jgi:hypothetical protein